MTDSFIKAQAENYAKKRFARASKAEQEKLIADWSAKVETSRQLVNDFKKRVGDPAGLKLLDAGCGNGGLAIAFFEAGALVYAVDLEEELISIAKAHAAVYRVAPSFVLYDGRRLPFSDNFFDAAASISVLEHTDDPVWYLSEILRVLKPGGRLYLAWPNRLWPKETHTLLWGLAYLPRPLADRLIRFFKRCPLKDNNLHFYNYWQVEKIISQAEAETGRFKILAEPGQSANPLKNIIKKCLNIFGLPYKAFLPHIQLILWKIKK